MQPIELAKTLLDWQPSGPYWFPIQSFRQKVSQADQTPLVTADRADRVLEMETSLPLEQASGREPGEIMRIGVFGGSFDPVHLGHLWIAEAARETLALTELRWIPAAQSPLKSGGPTASGSQRMTMLQLALAGLEDTIVDDRELRRGDVSYTVDTISDLQRELPGAELVLIIGSDSLATMQQWHRAAQLLGMTTLAVVRRGGEPEPDFSVLQGLVDPERIDLFRRCIIPMPLIEISSSELRERVAQGRSIRFRTPRAVEAFIRAEELYRPTSS